MTDKEFITRIRELLVADGYITNPVNSEQANEILYRNLLGNIMRHGKLWLRYFAYNSNE